MYVFIAEFVVQDPTKACTTDTMVTSLSECERAQAEFEPDKSDSRNAMKSEIEAEYPKGCYRWNELLYFNKHATGALLSEHEPICRSGKAGSNREPICLAYSFHQALTYVLCPCGFHKATHPSMHIYIQHINT